MKELKVKGTPQGDRMPAFVLSVNDKQIGMVAAKPDVWGGWIIMRTLKEMKSKTLAMTKEAFYARRDELLRIEGARREGAK